MEYYVEVSNPVHASVMLKHMPSVISLLNITSQERVKLRGDLVYVHKKFNDPDISTLRNDFRTRGIDKTLKIPNR